MIKNDKKIVAIAISICIYLSIALLVTFSAVVSASTPKPKFAIVIDAGHGGIDRGAYGRKTNVAESKINLEVATLLQKRLENSGFDVVMTRTGDYGLYGDVSKGFKRRDMAERKRIAENANATLLLSIHCNISTSKNTRGVVVYYDALDEKSKLLAENLQQELKKIKETENKVRIDSEEMFMTTSISLPSVIVECGFLSNETDEMLLIDEKYQKKLADKMYNGIFKTMFAQ